MKGECFIMTLNEKTYANIYEGLKRNFLYENDLNSIHILINLYDIEDNIRNIYPKYVTIQYIKNNISKFLKGREGNSLIASNLGELIHEDINRLELLLYLDGYKKGYADIKNANLLEKEAVEIYDINTLYHRKYLFQFDFSNQNINDFKEELFKNLKETDDYYKYLDDLIIYYCNKIIENKIMNLNNYLDSQLTIKCNTKSLVINDNPDLLSDNDLKSIYQEVVSIIKKNSNRLFKDAYWNGLNDRVLKRYK